MVVFAQQSRDDPSLVEVVDKFHERACSEGSYIDWGALRRFSVAESSTDQTFATGYHLIVTRADRETLDGELQALVAKGVTSIKLFTTYASMMLRDDELLDCLVAARRQQISVLLHAENGDIISFLQKQLEERGMVEPYYHGLARPPIVEAEATNRGIVLSELVQHPILFVHVGSALAMDAIRQAQTRGLPIRAETCPQYMHLSWDDMKRFADPQHVFHNSKFCCSPPPGPDGSDQEALWTGLANGTFTVYSSDHCPFSFNDKRGKALGVLLHKESMEGRDPDAPVHEIVKGATGHFAHIPNGCPGIETRVPILFNYGVEQGRITPERFVELTSTAAAKLYGMYPRKGAFVPGLSDADITIWYPKGKMAPFDLTNDHLHSDCDYTPFDGMHFKNWPRFTISRGQVMWQEGELVGKANSGEYIKRSTSYFPQRSVAPQDVRRVATWMSQ